MTMRLRTLRRRPLPADSPLRSFKSATRSRRDSFNAGPSPKAIVLTAANASVAASTRTSGLVLNVTLNGSAVINDDASARVVQ